MSLTLRVLKKFAVYDPDSGYFICSKKRPGCKTKLGGILGFPAGTREKKPLHLTVAGSVYSVHRLAWLWMTGSFPKKQIDHIDGNPQNNTWANLREVDSSLQTRNRAKLKNNTSGITGVCWAANMQAWCASVGRVKLGHFTTKELAEEARSRYLRDNPELGYTVRHGK